MWLCFSHNSTGCIVPICISFDSIVPGGHMCFCVIADGLNTNTIQQCQISKFHRIFYGGAQDTNTPGRKSLVN